MALPHTIPQDGDPTNDDTDGDGIPNYLDTDDDNDGYPTANEQPDPNGDHNPIPDAVDSDGDGIPNYLDDDDSYVDSDGDGIFDIFDLDDDNDGIPDTNESNGVDPLTDNDGDNVPVFRDDDDNDPTVGDANGQIEPGFDTDNDGIPNYLDLLSDGDGIYDYYEAGHGAADTNGDGRVDGAVGANGLLDALETSPDSGVINYTLADYDNDGTPDYLDSDDDDDHVPTVDEHPDGNTNNDHLPDDAQDTDNDGTPDYLDIDDDGDGIYTVNEDVALPHVIPQDGNPMNDDTDGDTFPNYLDTDDDNDGIPTANEHPDPNGDGNPIPDARDSDHDGIPDYLDTDPNEVDGIVVYNAVSPNGNGKNEMLYLDYIQYFHNININIYNRLGRLVWKGEGYDNSSVKFDGTDLSGKPLPAGTYYFILKYDDNDNNSHLQKGYLYLIW